MEEDLLATIKILKNFDIENDNIDKLQQVSKILWANNIKPTDIIMAIDLLEEGDVDLAEEHIEQAIRDLERIYKLRRFQQSK
jgi:hypothetical protein